MAMVNSTTVDVDDVSESVVDGLLDQLGEMPTSFFDVQIVVTVIVTPLPEGGADDEIGKGLMQCLRGSDHTDR